MNVFEPAAKHIGPLFAAVRSDVVALYVDPDGHYPGLVRDWYGEARNARTYTGSLPVVAHPPCGPWGRLKFLVKHQDASHGPHAVEVVQRVGGVLEHPLDSKLWTHCGLPFPGQPTDRHGGRTFLVNQSDFGHKAKKPTWLYCVRTAEPVLPERRGWTHRVTNGPRGGTDLPRA